MENIYLDGIKRMLQFNSRPCWHVLLYNTEKRTLILKVHKDLVNYIYPPKSDFDWLPGYYKKAAEEAVKERSFKTSDIEFGKKYIGFNECGERKEDDGDFIVYEFSLPKGMDGKRNAKKLEAVSISLCLLFDKLDDNHIVHEISGPFPQLMQIKPWFGKGSKSFNVSGVIGIEMHKYFLQLSPSRKEPKGFDDAITAMKKYNRYSKPTAYIKGGELTVSADTMSAADIGPDIPRDTPDPERGYDMTGHNTDGPMMQIGILIGLAKVWEKALKDLGCTKYIKI